MAGKKLSMSGDLWTETQGNKSLEVDEQSFNGFRYKGHVSTGCRSVGWSIGAIFGTERAIQGNGERAL